MFDLIYSKSVKLKKKISMKLHEKINTRIVAITTAILLFLLADYVEAQTAAGAAHHHQATRRRTAVVVSSATHAKDEQAASADQQEAPPPAAEPAPAASTSTSATTSTPAPATSSESLPIGTVVSKLPEGCVSTSVDNIEYYQCGPNYYRAVFQDNTLVYVTTDPPK